MSERTCTVSDCTRPSRKRGMCNRHYENLRLRGSAVPQRDRSLGDRLQEIGWTVTPRGCWEWSGSRNADGYGIFTATRLGLANARAHRLLYELAVGPIPEGLLLRHSCDNPPCVNPDHLIPGTQDDNMKDMVERGRHWRYGRTECDNGHDLTLPGATRKARRRGGTETVCVTCARDRNERYMSQKRALQ